MVYETTPEGIQSYLRNLTTKFNRDPQGLPIARIDDKLGGGHVRVRDFTLSLVPALTSTARRVEIDLTTRTLAQLAADLGTAGYTLSILDAHYSGLSAAIIAEMDAPYTGRAYLSVATSMLWRVLVPVALEGRTLADEADRAAQQLDLRIATGRWLDRMAALYGTLRYDGEGDAELRGRIDYKAVRARVNATSLSAFIANVLGLKNTITDGKKHTFHTNQHASRTVVRGSTRVHTTTATTPQMTVTVHQTLPADIAPYPLRDEVGKRFWFRTTNPTSRTWNPDDIESYSRTPPSVAGYYRPFADRVLLPLLPQQSGRKLWQFVDENKAAGVRHLLILPQVVQADDSGGPDYILQTQNAPHVQDALPATGFVQSVIINRLLPDTPPTSLVRLGLAVSNNVAGPTRVTKHTNVSNKIRSLARLRLDTSAYVAQNFLTADETVWPIQRQVVRKSTETHTIVRERVMKQGSC